MEQQKIANFMSTYGKYFPAGKRAYIEEGLSKCPNEKYNILSTINYKNPTTITVLSVFFGGLGVDRFMLGQTGMGILKFLTGGLFGILTIIDWFTVGKKAREWNYQEISKRL
ncbi:MAG: TM2 domain-containing protein [Clostridia bacterium]|nr:TM2 domain-containing protein [Clostridia bacterium]MDE7349236.1 TM2 domain-containing protein [Clostridia bacterium]